MLQRIARSYVEHFVFRFHLHCYIVTIWTKWLNPQCTFLRDNKKILLIYETVTKYLKHLFAGKSVLCFIWILNKYLYTHIHSIIHDSEKVEATEVSISWWMHKQNKDYTYNGILLSLKKEGSLDTCYYIDETWRS